MHDELVDPCYDDEEEERLRTFSKGTAQNHGHHIGTGEMTGG